MATLEERSRPAEIHSRNDKKKKKSGRAVVILPRVRDELDDRLTSPLSTPGGLNNFADLHKALNSESLQMSPSPVASTSCATPASTEAVEDISDKPPPTSSASDFVGTPVADVVESTGVSRVGDEETSLEGYEEAGGERESRRGGKNRRRGGEIDAKEDICEDADPRETRGHFDAIKSDADASIIRMNPDELSTPGVASTSRTLRLASIEASLQHTPTLGATESGFIDFDADSGSSRHYIIAGISIV